MTHKITLYLSDNQALALAQYAKRMTYEDAFRRSESMADAYDILATVSVIAQALHDAGISPR